MNHRDKLLNFLADYGALTRESLLMLNHTDIRYAQRLIKSCIEDKLIAEIVLNAEVRVGEEPPKLTTHKKIINGQRIKKLPQRTTYHEYALTTKYYTLTDKGLQYLVDKGDWIMSDQDKQDAIAKRKLFSRRGETSVPRLLGISTAAVMLHEINGLSYPFYDDQFFTAYIADYPETFANAKTVKAVVQNGGIFKEAMAPGHDYDRGSYSGCFFSRESMLVVYNNFLPGFRWYKQAAEPEYKAVRLFQEAVIRDHDLKGINLNACILVKNAKHLRQIVLDGMGARRGTEKAGSKALALGAPYRSMYAIPTNTDGLKHLKYLLSDNIRDINYDALCSICHKTGFSEYEDHGFTWEKTALERTGDKSIRKFIVTTVMDLRVMDRLRKSLRDPKSGKYGVYCQSWQVPYWKAIFGDTITIRTIPEELLPHIDLDERQRRAAKSAARSTETPNFDVLYEGLYPDEDEERNEPETEESNSDDIEIDWDNADIDWDNIDVDWDNADIDLKARDWSDLSDLNGL